MLSDSIGAFFEGGRGLYHSPIQPQPVEPSCLGPATWSNFVADKDFNVKGYTSYYFAAHLINLEWVQHRSGVHHMFPSSANVREVAEIERRLADKVVDLLSEPEVWIIDETAFPKAGQHSVGVARQYCGTLGKVANCQVAVSLHWATAEASCPILWRLYLPKEWLEDAERAAEVKLPPATPYRTKTELALEVIDQALDGGLPPCRWWRIRSMGMTIASASRCANVGCPMRFRSSPARWCGRKIPTT